MESSDLPVPQGVVAGKYRLTRLLGRGGMGAVWEGTHVSLGTRVAVKFIDAEYAESPEARSRFENEARAAARLRSKHVVEVYDHGVSEDGRPFIVMEFLHGEPLDKRLDRLGRLPSNETAQIVMQICRALSKAHAANIVHRDLKPENVFLVWDDEEGTDVVKIVDFGIAKFNDASMSSSSATRTGSILGTPHYMSPEQARGLRSVDSRSDLWSVAVIAYRCIVGGLPFEGEAVGDLLVKLCTAPIPQPSQIAPGVPPNFDAWLEKALTREPGQRFQTAAELAESLANVCGLSLRGQEGGSGPYSAVGSGSFSAAPTGLTFPTGISAVSVGNPLSVGLLTGAPTVQTPVPVKRRTSGAQVGLVLGALLIVASGGAFATRFLLGPPAMAVAVPPPSPAAPAGPATPHVQAAEPPQAASAPSSSGSKAEPLASATALAATAQPLASATATATTTPTAVALAKAAAHPQSRPLAKPVPKPASRPSQKVTSDIGF